MVARDTSLGRPSAAFAWAAWTVAVVLMIGSKSGALWTDSVDLAHHYSLAERLSETGTWVGRVDWRGDRYDGSLSEMAEYPRGAHILAAVAGRILGSTLIGMQVVALLAVIGTWAGFAAAISTLPHQSATVAASTTAILLATSKIWLHLPVHGDEIVGSYFFAQLVAQCVEIWVVVVLIILIRRGSPSGLVIGLAIAAVAVIGCFHLLPAVELLAFVGCWLAFDLLSAGHDRAGWLRGLAAAAATMIAGATVILLHPSFDAMRRISENNGVLDIPFVDRPATLVALALAAGLASIAVLMAWRNRFAGADHAAVKLLALHGIAVALVALAQFVAWRLGFGSEYAAKKYAYGLFSAPLIDAGLAAALAPWRQWPSWLPAASRFSPIAFSVVAFFSVLPAGEMTGLARIVALEGQIKLLRDTRLPWSDGRADIVVGLDGISSRISYLLSIGVLRMPRDKPGDGIVQSGAILQNNTVNDLSSVGTVITSISSVPYDIPACREFVSANGLALVNAACIADWFRRHDVCDGRVQFGAGSSYPLRITGFSAAETTGRWTDGPTAVFRCAWPGIGRRAPTRVSLDMTAFLAASRGLSEQRVTISIDGGIMIEHRFRAGADRQTVDVPLGPNVGSDLVIRFALPDAAVPAALGISRDPRRLGVQVHSVTFE